MIYLSVHYKKFCVQILKNFLVLPTFDYYFNVKLTYNQQIIIFVTFGAC